MGVFLVEPLLQEYIEYETKRKPSLSWVLEALLQRLRSTFKDDSVTGGDDEAWSVDFGPTSGEGGSGMRTSNPKMGTEEYQKDVPMEPQKWTC